MSHEPDGPFHFDAGGILPGPSMVRNTTGVPERVLTVEHSRHLAWLLADEPPDDAPPHP